ncbi:MAG: YtxH domain-containing protein [Pedobacter sp.]|nr:MAG: YtxH domain-containing protein [Pedobacter sp.]
MKYRKIFERLLSHRSEQNNAQVAVALVAGLAAGAVISILFAPNKGSETRGAIAGRARGLGDGIKDTYCSLKDRLLGHELHEELAPENEVPHFKHTVAKKRKSDIKQLVDEAHKEVKENDPSLN